MNALGLVFVAAFAVGQARPVTLVSEVRAAIAAHDHARAEALVNARRVERGDTPETIEAMSWLARGDLGDRGRSRRRARGWRRPVLLLSGPIVQRSISASGRR